jgi:hypothetical protein
MPSRVNTQASGLGQAQDLRRRLQTALDRLSAEQPNPLLLGCTRLAAHTTAGAIRHVWSDVCRREPPSMGPGDDVEQLPGAAI